MQQDEQAFIVKGHVQFVNGQPVIEALVLAYERDLQSTAYRVLVDMKLERLTFDVIKTTVTSGHGLLYSSEAGYNLHPGSGKSK